MAKRSRGDSIGQEKQAQVHHEASLGHLEDCWDEPPVPAQGRSDLDRLQGAWACPTGRRPAVLLVSGSHFTIHFADGDIYVARFELEPAARPRAMVVHIAEGPARHKGQPALCFYEFDGDSLRWCTAGPGRTDRPAAFPSQDDPNYLCLVFRRDKLEARRG